jgi:hypothetical protein
MVSFVVLLAARADQMPQAWSQTPKGKLSWGSYERVLLCQCVNV